MRSFVVGCVVAMMVVMVVGPVVGVAPFAKRAVLGVEVGAPAPPPPPSNLGKFFTQQKVDHFSGSDETYSQRYYVNTTFFTPGSDAPVFLCTGGETPLYNAVVHGGDYHCGYAVNVLAPKYGALLVGLEHRVRPKPKPSGARLVRWCMVWSDGGVLSVRVWV